MKRTNKMKNIKVELNNLIDEIRIAEFFEQIDNLKTLGEIEIKDISSLNRLRDEYIFGNFSFDYNNRLRTWISTNITIIFNPQSRSTATNLTSENEITQENAKILISEFIESLLQTTERNSELKELKFQLCAKEQCKFSKINYFKFYLSDGAGIIILHINGNLATKAFYVRKGIGYYYRTNFDLVDENLGLPISSEHSCGASAKNSKTDFENGFIEWIADENALYIYVAKLGDTKLLDRYQY
jgi:hypothetical protein